MNRPCAEYGRLWGGGTWAAKSVSAIDPRAPPRRWKWGGGGGGGDQAAAKQGFSSEGNPYKKKRKLSGFGPLFSWKWGIIPRTLKNGGTRPPRPPCDGAPASICWFCALTHYYWRVFFSLHNAHYYSIVLCSCIRLGADASEPPRRRPLNHLVAAAPSRSSLIGYDGGSTEGGRYLGRHWRAGRGLSRGRELVTDWWRTAVFSVHTPPLVRHPLFLVSC